VIVYERTALNQFWNVQCQFWNGRNHPCARRRLDRWRTSRPDQRRPWCGCVATGGGGDWRSMVTVYQNYWGRRTLPDFSPPGPHACDKLCPTVHV
jgi:hypothetical protein